MPRPMHFLMPLAVMFCSAHPAFTQYVQTASLHASDDTQRFGTSVDMKEDVAVVGAFLDNDAGTQAGAAYVFYRTQEGAHSWQQVAKLTASDGAPGDTGSADLWRFHSTTTTSWSGLPTRISSMRVRVKPTFSFVTRVAPTIGARYPSS